MSNTFSVNSKLKGVYNVYFINNLQESLNNNSNDNTIYLIDNQIAILFKNELNLIFNQNRFILLNISEKNKTLTYAKTLITKLLNLNVRKSDVLVAIGGGITQDIVAFISSILFRGLDWKYYPTTLLGQCDSCIGSKSSINFEMYKNLLGTFNPPSEIFIYNGFLNTLSSSEIKSGLGEMLHYFFFEGIELAQKLSDQFETLINDRTSLSFFIYNSLRIKKNIIEIDEFDTSIRHLFNYGHTFGHALEAITNYRIPHGQAITLGMDLANFISLKLNLISEHQFEEMHSILILNKPNFIFSMKNIDSYINALKKDKKNEGNQLGCILTLGPGNLKKMFLNIDNNLINLILDYSIKIK